MKIRHGVPQGWVLTWSIVVFIIHKWPYFEHSCNKFGYVCQWYICANHWHWCRCSSQQSWLGNYRVRILVSKEWSYNKCRKNSGYFNFCGHHKHVLYTSADSQDRPTNNNLNVEGKEKYHHYETHKGNMSMISFMHVKCSIIIATDK